MRKNVTHLMENGPETPDGLPYSIGPADKLHGVRVFKLTSATKTKVGGMITPVYYIEGEHSKESVLRAFLQENPQLVNAMARQSLHRMIGGHGSEWKDIVADVTGEFYRSEASSDASA